MSIYDEALAVRCPTCKAEPGVECDAPQKRAKFDRVAAHDNAAGIEHHKLHVARQGLGIRRAVS